MMATLVYLAAIAAVEVLTVLESPLYGVVWYCGLVVTFLGLYVLQPQTPARRLLPVITLVPLMRVIGLGMTVPNWSPFISLGLIGAPMMVAAFLTIRQLRLPWARAGLSVRFPGWQVLIALSGAPLGLLGYLILRPPTLLEGTQWLAILAATVVLVLIGGFTEELIFRGIFLPVAAQAFGAGAAVLMSAALFASMHLGTLSLGYTVFAGIVGLYFGACVHFTGSIWGSAFARSIMLVGVYLAPPALLG